MQISTSRVATFCLVILIAIQFCDSLSTIVSTKYGPLQGFEDSTGIVQFLGVPYAKPPVGNLRWKPPQPPTPWGTVRSATDFSSACPQNARISDYTFPANVTFSEDCLYLNVYAPNTPNMSKTVMFWIHGGGFHEGGNSEYRLRGEFMAKSADVVVVVINYRLGALGFLAHPYLFQEDPNVPTTGNYGILDQNLALMWVRDNIASFGGDPAKVTIFGESAGGSSIMYHLIISQSQGLFNSAIIQSAAAFVEVASLDVAEKSGVQTQQDVNCTSGTPQDILNCMRSVPASAYVALDKGGAVSTVVCVDGYVFKEHPYQSVKHGRIANVPMLAGNVLNDGTLFANMNTPLPPSAYAQAIENTFYSFAPMVLGEYPCVNQTTCNDVLADAAGDFSLICPTLLLANSAAQKSPGINYGYVFTHMPSWIIKTNPKLGVYHSCEIPFVFSTLGISYPHTPEETQLEAIVTDFWTSFGKYYRPAQASKSVYWPTYNSSTYDRMMIDLPLKTSQNYKQKMCIFWTALYDYLYNY